jgi:molecular chaperone GrpE
VSEPQGTGTTGTTDTRPPGTAPEAEVAPIAADGDTEPADGGAGTSAGGGGGGEPELAEEETAAEQVISDLDRLQMERNDYLDQLLRTRADFDNYRKRMIKQQTEHLERAAEALVGKLLGVLDVLDGANAHGEGFEQVGAHLVATLEKEGLERVDPVGRPFDPNEADAVAHEAGAGDEGGGGPVVAAVLRPGYRWKGRLLRPAMVKVRG